MRVPALMLGVALALLPRAAQAMVIEYFFQNATFTDSIQSSSGFSGVINGSFNYNLETSTF